MNYTLRDEGSTREVSMSGRLTFADHEAFRSVIAGMTKGGPRRYVLDVGGLEFIDSAGLGMLLLAKDTAEESGVELSLKGAQGQVKKMLDVARFSDIIPTIEG